MPNNSARITSNSYVPSAIIIIILNLDLITKRDYPNYNDDVSAQFDFAKDGLCFDRIKHFPLILSIFW